MTASGPVIVRAAAQFRQSSRMLALKRTRSPITLICFADMTRACSSTRTDQDAFQRLSLASRFLAPRPYRP